MNEQTKLPRKMTKTVGVSGTQITNGIVTAEEYNSKLVGTNGLKLYDIMRRSDATVRSTLQVVKLPISRVEWRIEAASDDEQDKFIADFIDYELIESGRITKLIKDALTELDFGFSLIEKTLGLTIYKNKTLLGISDLGYRKQTSIYQWEMEDGNPGVLQRTASGHKANIPREKLMYFVFDQEGDNYFGTSLLRYAYKSWDIKDKLDLLNVVGLEKGSVGVPVLRVPADAGEKDKEAADDAMREFRANEEAYMRLPIGFEVEMLDLKAASTKDVLPSIKYHDRQIQLSVLAQFLSIGTTDSGARATSEDHSKLFLMSEEAEAQHIRDIIQTELIEQLCDLNFSNMPNGYPKLRFGKIGDDDIVEVGDFVQKAYSTGAMKYDPKVENHLRKLARFPELSDEEIEAIEEKQELMLTQPTQTMPNGNDPQQTIEASRKIRQRLIDIVR